MPFSAQHIKAARLHLQKSEPTMRRIIRRVGPFTAKTQRNRFLTLVRSIASQQISGAAARTILGRLDKLMLPGKVTPENLVSRNVHQLREVGFSNQKASYILDLANQVHSGAVNLSAIGRQEDDAVIAELTKIKGIGVWTAQMFLMFSLGRLDVFPSDDLGIQSAIKKQYLPRGQLNKKRMEKIAQPWRPYATVASWYLWRSLEFDD